MIMLKPVYRIGDYVYHRTIDSPKGIVTDCRYSLRYNEWTYLISFSHNESEMYYVKEELSETPIIV